MRRHYFVYPNQHHTPFLFCVLISLLFYGVSLQQKGKWVKSQHQVVLFLFVCNMLIVFHIIHGLFVMTITQIKGEEAKTRPPETLTNADFKMLYSKKNVF